MKMSTIVDKFVNVEPVIWPVQVRHQRTHFWFVWTIWMHPAIHSKGVFSYHSATSCVPVSKFTIPGFTVWSVPSDVDHCRKMRHSALSAYYKWGLHSIYWRDSRSISMSQATKAARINNSTWTSHAKALFSSVFLNLTKLCRVACDGTNTNVPYMLCLTKSLEKS